MSWIHAMSKHISRLEALLGVPFFTDSAFTAGIVHVTACLIQAGSLTTINLGPAAPSHPLDHALLVANRASCDAVLQAAGTVRDEAQRLGGLPDSYHVSGTGAPEVFAWRRRRLAAGIGREGPCLILTASGDLPPSVFAQGPGSHDAPRSHAPAVLTASSGVQQARACVPAYIPLHHTPHPSPQHAIALLRGMGAQRIAVEGGPSLARQMYASPEPRIDYLLLSTLKPDSRSAAVPAEAKGKELLHMEQLRDEFYPLAPGFGVDSVWGRWCFQLWRRR